MWRHVVGVALFVLVAQAACQERTGAGRSLLVEVVNCTSTVSSEVEALRNLFESTNGEGWLRNDGWLEGDPCVDQWHGIECTLGSDELCHIKRISLSQNQLSGQIPELSPFGHLRGLDLRRNDLTGTIPNLNSLRRLSFVVLASNHLIGPIPSLRGMSKLTAIALAHNALSGAIPDLSSLVNLDSLVLSFNALQGSIPPLESCALLTTLDVQGNMLTGTIPPLDALSRLRYIYLNDNVFVGALPSLLHVGVGNDNGGVIRIKAENNRLSGNLSAALAGTTAFDGFNVTNNLFSCPLPMWCSAEGDGSCEPCVEECVPVCVRVECEPDGCGRMCGPCEGDSSGPPWLSIALGSIGTIALAIGLAIGFLWWWRSRGTEEPVEENPEIGLEDM